MSNIKNPTLTGTETAVQISGQNAAIRNDGTDIIYASAAPGISAGADGVVSVPAGQSVVLSDIHGAVYLLGTGGATVIGKDDNTNPFKMSTAAGGSAVDEVARTAIGSHAGNADIHVTAEEKAAWNAAINPNLLINPDFAVNQRGVSGIITTTGYFVDRWKLESGTVTLNADGTLTLDGTISQTLEKAVGADVTAHASAGSAGYDAGTKTFTLTASGEVISWAKLEIGAIATPFTSPDPATELAKCQRYFCKSYLPANAPGTAGAYLGEIILNAASSSKFGQSYFAFPVSMRDIPTVTIYNPETGEAGVICHAGNTDTASASALVPGTQGFNLLAGGLTQGDDYYMHYTASAEH